MAPIISLDSLVGIMSTGLDEGFMYNSIFIRAFSDISLKQLNKFRQDSGGTEVHRRDRRCDVSPDTVTLIDKEGRSFLTISSGKTHL